MRIQFLLLGRGQSSKKSAMVGQLGRGSGTEGMYRQKI